VSDVIEIISHCIMPLHNSTQFSSPPLGHKHFHHSSNWNKKSTHKTRRRTFIIALHLEISM